MAKRVKESAPVEEIVRVEEPALEAVPEPQSQPEAVPVVVTGPRPSLGQRIRRFFAILLRLVVILLIGTAIGTGLYFGVPLVYQKYILPVQENTSQLAQLQTRQAQSQQELTDLRARLDAVATGQAQQAQSLTALDGRMGQVEAQIAAHTQALAALDQMQSTLQATDAETARQIRLMKAMELLSRARLFLYQSNFGLAKQDVQTARDLLVLVQPSALKPLTEDLTEIILRLNLVLNNLPDFPVAASDDLDIAWQILLSGMPLPQATTATPTPQVTIEPTATP